MNEILEFLYGLKENNTLDWMHAHKQEYKRAGARFEAIVAELIRMLAPEEPDLAGLNVKELTFRLNRDTRFSADKSPYRTAFRAHISPGGKAPIPVGYFLHIAPGGSFFGGGLFVPPGLTEMTNRVRDAILANGDEFASIVTDPAFCREYAVVGEKLKQIPRGYPVNFPQGEYLKHKSWVLEQPFPDEALDDEAAFVAAAAEKFRLMRPFHAFLNRALEGYQMPARGK